jgi:hypothetical protein
MECYRTTISSAMPIDKCERKRKIEEVFWSGNAVDIAIFEIPKKKLKISN